MFHSKKNRFNGWRARGWVRSTAHCAETSGMEETNVLARQLGEAGLKDPDAMAEGLSKIGMDVEDLSDFESGHSLYSFLKSEGV